MKKILSSLCALGVFVASLGVVSADFSDVTQDDFYFDAVAYLESEGIIHGNPDGSFGYSYPINRAELLTIVIRAKFLEGDPAEVDAYTDANCFNDSVNQWYTKYVCYSKAQGWVGGYPDGTFKPYQDVNFVEALKISMQVLGIDYDEGTEPWYKGLVESASAKNLIPLSISAFDQKITRGEMADLVARILKYKAEGLDEWLGDKKDCVVTYETIEAGTNMVEFCGLVANGGVDDDENDPVLDFGPLFVDWSFPDNPDHTLLADEGGDGLMYQYTNNMFSLWVDGNGLYWYGPLTESDFATELVEPSDEGLMFDTFNEDEFCLGTAYEDFHDLIMETSKLAALEIPVFDIELGGEPFTWWMTVFATRNPLGWDMVDAQWFMSCTGTTMVPIKVVDNYLYDGVDNGAIIWVDECPEKGIEPEKADYCSDMRGSVMSQLNPDLIGDQ